MKSDDTSELARILSCLQARKDASYAPNHVMSAHSRLSMIGGGNVRVQYLGKTLFGEQGLFRNEVDKKEKIKQDKNFSEIVKAKKTLW
jgi:hypothetical protein